MRRYHHPYPHQPEGRVCRQRRRPQSGISIGFPGLCAMIKHKIISIMVSIALLLCNLARAQAANEPVPEQLHQIEALQRRAENLAFGALGTDNYHLAKARAWLDMALLEYHQMDTSGSLTAAMAQAQTLLDALENKQPEIGMDTPLQISGSESVRPDLQKQIATLKKHAN